MVRILSCLFLWCCLGQAHGQGSAARSPVFYGNDPELMDGFEANGPSVESMTDNLVMAVTGRNNLAAAWRSMVAPQDHVGIKIDGAGGRDFSTHRAIVDAVLRGLIEAGIPMSQVVIWDRTNPRESGYEPRPRGAAVRGIEPFTGYDPKSVVDIPRVGKLIWGDVEFSPRAPDPLSRVRMNQYSVESHWSRLICGLNKIINIPVMSASEDCGVAGCIYNVTIPNVDNWRRFLNPPESGDPYLCDLFSDAHVRPKVVLNLMDGLIAQYGGGPDWQPGYSWNHATLYASKDPVAIDATALRLIESWRKNAGLPALTPRAKYLRTAAAMDLGNFDAGQIDLIREGR